MKLWTLLFLSVGVLGASGARAAHLVCTDGHTTVAFSGNGPVNRAYEGVEVPLRIEGGGHAIWIRRAGGVHRLETNVLLTADGAGARTYQVFELTPQGAREVVRLRHDGETGRLRGFYSLPVYEPGRDGRDRFAGYGRRRELPRGQVTCEGP